MPDSFCLVVDSIRGYSTLTTVAAKNSPKIVYTIHSFKHRGPMNSIGFLEKITIINNEENLKSAQNYFKTGLDLWLSVKGQITQT